MIITNKYIPVKGFTAMAAYPFIFLRVGKALNTKILNHEKIHFAQQKELWVIGFYILYLYYWVLRGYKKIPFEIEARTYQNYPMYLHNRKKFHWRTYG